MTVDFNGWGFTGRDGDTNLVGRIEHYGAGKGVATLMVPDLQMPSAAVIRDAEPEEVQWLLASGKRGRLHLCACDDPVATAIGDLRETV